MSGIIYANNTEKVVNLKIEWKWDYESGSTIEEALEKNPCANRSGWNRACFRKRQKKNAAAETERMGRSMSCQTQAIHK